MPSPTPSLALGVVLLLLLRSRDRQLRQVAVLLGERLGLVGKFDALVHGADLVDRLAQALLQRL